MSLETKSTDFIQSLARGLDILELCAANNGEVTVAEVATQTGLNRATARRLLLTLEQLEYLHRTGRSYRLTPRMLQLGYRYLAGLGISELVAEHLDSLAAALGEAVSLTVRDGDEIVYLARARLDKVMTIALNVGARLPVWTTSMGRVLLSALPDDEIRGLYPHTSPPQAATPQAKTALEDILVEVEKARRDGYYLIDQELEWGLRSIAVPVFRHGEIFAALNVATANVAEDRANTLARVLPDLQATAVSVSGVLEASPARPQPAGG
mgnify:CR=1 FL=1